MARGKRVEIVKIIVDGAEVDAKACTKCGEVKALMEFYRNRALTSGVDSRCKECVVNLRKDMAESEGRVFRTRKMWKEVEYAREVESTTRNEYTLVGKYLGSTTKTEHKHGACGHTWSITPNHFLRGTRCPKCSTRAKKTTSVFKNEVSELYGGQYSVLGSYKGAHVKILMKHTLCGHEWEKSPSSLLGGSGCPRCFGKPRRDHAWFINMVHKLGGGEYTVLDKYSRYHAKLRLHHVSCGHTWGISPAKFLSGRRCPRCAESCGERTIRSFLTVRGIQFTPQYSFENCRHIMPLPFDAVVQDNGQIIAIEYDGEHHSRPVSFGEKDKRKIRDRFESTQRNDRIKTDYCLANGIPLIRINYTEFDRIEEILTQRLAELGVTGKRLNGSNAQDSSETSFNNVKSIAQEDAA
ncbi:hypothetical protein D1872_71420 [compost metagenome]